MSHAVIIALLVCPAVVIGLGWAALRPLREERASEPGDKIEDLFPLHTQHFPQLKQALASTDKRYVGQKLSGKNKRSWDSERRIILRSFLDGLAGDFGRVIRLGRLLDSQTPDSTRPRGMERSWPALRFRLHHRILSLRILGGGPVVIWHIRRLTASVGSLAAVAETAMMRLQTKEEEAGVPSSFNA